MAHFIAQAWHRDTGDAGIIGTIGYGPLDSLKPAAMTTPDPISLQAMLADCLDQDIEKVAMEVSSHALAQGRCDDVAFDAAVFTNLSRDHLDYHGSMEAYEEAKRRLFTDCKPRFAVINHDDAAGKALSRHVAQSAQVLSYGTNGSTELRASIMNMDSSGITLTIASPWGGGKLHTGLLGAFNVSNLLAAAGIMSGPIMPWPPMPGAIIPGPIMPMGHGWPLHWPPWPWPIWATWTGTPAFVALWSLAAKLGVASTESAPNTTIATAADLRRY